MAVNRNFLISLYKFPKSHSISAKMLVIGAGKMGKLVFKHLASKGCRKIIVVQAPVEVHILWCIKYHDIFWVMASSRDRAWNVLLALGNIAFAYTFVDVLIEIQLVGIRTIAKDAELLHQEGAREVYYACSTHTIFSPPAIEGLSSGLFQEVIITNTIPVLEQKSLPSVYISFLAKLLGETIWRVHDDCSLPTIVYDPYLEILMEVALEDILQQVFLVT